MKIALVHDWFKANGGAEKVAGSIAALYAENDVTIYTLFNKFSKSDSDAILQHFPVKTSLMQHIPGIAAIYRYFLPVMPWLIEQFYLKQYDVVISTSHAVAKGIRVKEGVLNICYCHSPMRYVWDMYDDYVAQHGVSKIPMYRWLLQAIRKWDYQSSARVHFFIANSHHIKARIQKSYGRDATVIYPPVRTHLFQRYDGPRKHYFLCLGRLVPYKKMDLIARAFTQMPDKELVLIGEGYGSKDFVSVVEHSPNITWLGYQPDDVLIEYIQKAKACIFAAKEDFGISCVEVQACGQVVELELEVILLHQMVMLLAHPTLSLPLGKALLLLLNVIFKSTINKIEVQVAILLLLFLMISVSVKMRFI
ncbi:MAG: glycosyltransferase family 4 protein [Chitinophagia bacterium]|nr:glycosyltransferase family 4 protein [Chitinophagia bacterium]